MKIIPVVTLLLLALSLAACEGVGKDKRYLDASVGRGLELPPDLSESTQESSFELPAGFSGTDPTVRDKVPVLAKVDSLSLESSGDLYWLNVDAPVDDLYQKVKDFWTSEGYSLSMDEPVIGIMQTEWVLTEEGAGQDESSWFGKLFGDDNLSASQDQFRTRIERVPNGSGSRIYISHRGTEYIYVLKAGDKESPVEGQGDDNQWRFRQPEPELEIEMLSRLMIFLGLGKAEVDLQVANARLFRPRASKHIDAEEKSPYLLLKDPYQIAWNRIYHQLVRMNFEIAGEEYQDGLSGEGAIIVNLQVSGNKDGSGLFSFFSSSSETVKRQIVLVLAEQTHELTRITIETIDGDFDMSPEGAAFLDLLYQNIR